MCTVLAAAKPRSNKSCTVWPSGQTEKRRCLVLFARFEAPAFVFSWLIAIFDRAMAIAWRGFCLAYHARGAAAGRRQDRSPPILPALWSVLSAQVFPIPGLRDLFLIPVGRKRAGAKECFCKCGEHDALFRLGDYCRHTCLLWRQMRLRDKFIM